MTKTAYSRNTALLLGLLMAASVAGVGAEPQVTDNATDSVKKDKNVAQVDVDARVGPLGAGVDVDLGFDQRHRTVLNDLFTEDEETVIPMNVRTMIRTNAENYYAPGIRRDPMVGQPLPSEITRQVVYLPASVNERLDWELEPQYRVGVYGTDVFLYDTSNNRVLDILDDVFEPADVEVDI